MDPSNPPSFTREGDVGFGAGLVDQIYLETEAEAMLHVGSGAAVSVENTAGWTDTVVWNPGPGTLAGTGDMWYGGAGSPRVHPSLTLQAFNA